VFVRQGELAEGAQLSAAVCIVGAGAAGITLALSLQDAGIPIVLVESGTLEFDESVEALDKGQAVGIPYDLDAQRRRGFGGSTNCWAGWCVPMSPQDFVARDWMAGSGWPITRADLDRYYPAAARVLDIAGHEFDSRAWLPHLGLQGPPVALDGFDCGIWQLSPPARLGEKYRSAVESSARIRCVLGFTATRLTLEKGGPRIQSVTCRSLGRKSLTVKASLFVLAMGGIENARLLLLSRDQRPAGLGNENDLVGRNFLEHPAAVEGAELYVWKDGPGHEFFAKAGKGLQARGYPAMPAAGASLSASLDAPPRKDPASVVLGLSIAEAAQRRHRLPQFWAVPIEGPFPDPAREREAKEVLSALAQGKERPFSRIGLNFAIEQRPSASSRVRLGDERDPLGEPVAVLDWRIDAQERTALKQCLALLGEATARAGVGRMRLNIDPESERSWVPVGGAHLMGTTPMGVDAKTSVADRNGRLHSVRNAYLAGSSLFPTSTYGNPTYTIVALALRLGDHLKAILARA
jgi:choline dehydrogenase-like flavoprotein